MNVLTMPTQDISFTNVAEAFVRAVRAGENPTVAEFSSRYPKYAEEIRDEFPLILMAEQLNVHTKQETKTSTIPTKIGKYRITGEIGKGGMGQVYAATQFGLNRQVAIKVISVAVAEQRDSLIRFQREAKSAGKLNHPNIVPVYDYGVHEQLLYFVMPRIKGLDLSRIIEGLSLERSRSTANTLSMDWRMVADVGAQVAGALGYAHTQGLIHRDIKPANLIMESSGRTWITDFGLVKNMQCDQSLSRTGDLIGTPRYMAPEQLRGVSDARSDIYGLGLTLYELASGRRAWDELSGYELVTRRSTLELPPIQAANHAIPEALCAIIMKCCAFKPDERYQTANEIQYVLNRYLHGHRVGDRRKARNSERSILKRRPIRLARALITLGGIAMFGGLLYYATAPKNPFADPVGSVSMLKDEKVRTDFIKQLPSIIEQVVHSEDPELRSAVGDIAKETLTHNLEGNEAIPAAIKQEMKKELAAHVTDFKEGKLSTELPLSGHYHTLNPLFIQASEFDWVYPQLLHSGLSDREKSSGQKLLMNLKKGIIEQRVSALSTEKLRQKAHSLLMAHSIAEQPERPTGSTLSDHSLRMFLGYIELEVSDLDERVVLPVQTRSRETVVNAIDSAMKNPEVRKFLNSIK